MTSEILLHYKYWRNPMKADMSAIASIETSEDRDDWRDIQSFQNH